MSQNDGHGDRSAHPTPSLGPPMPNVFRTLGIAFELESAQRVGGPTHQLQVEILEQTEYDL